MKSNGDADDVDDEDDIEVEGLTIEELNTVKFDHAVSGTPAYIQQQADQEARKWHLEWGEGIAQDEIQWPEEIDDELVELLADNLVEASRTFPNETGLGWDRLHPKAIQRLSAPTLHLLVQILVDCEKQGTWPQAVPLVLIALLPKSDGGCRPIGLIPFSA